MSESTVHWPRVIAHAAIALVVAVIVVGFGIATFTSLGWYVAGAIAIAAALAVGVASFLSQRGSRRRTTVLAATLAAVVVLAAAVVPSLRQGEPPKPSYLLTAADHGPLVDAGTRYRHPTLGFSFDKPPGGFKQSPQLVDYVNKKLGNAGIAYGFTDPDNRASFMVLVLPASGNDTDSLERTLDEFVTGMTAGDQGVRVHERTVGSGSARIAVQLRGGYLRAELHAIRAGTGWVHVMLVVGSPRQNFLTDVLASFQA